MKHLLISSLGLSALLFPLAASAQDAVPVDTDEENATAGEIVVVAERIRGMVDTPLPPVATLDETDIEALGAASLTDVLARLAPQTGSGRGRGGGFPVVLVNGQRVSGFREMRNYPPEALKRIEVLPEEVALRYGFSPDQRVVNFILKDNFASKTLELDYGQPDRGGFRTIEGEGSLLRIGGPNRFNLTAKIDDTSPLTEAERRVIQEAGSLPTVAGDPDPALFRTLVADSRELSLNASWSRGLGKDGLGGQLSLNGTVTRSDSRSLSGLDSVVLVAPGGASERRTLSDPLVRKTGVTTLQGGGGLNTFLGDWQLSATVDASHSETRSEIDRRADTSTLVAAAAAGTLAIDGVLPAVSAAGIDRSATNADSATGLVTLIGRPLDLPAGPVQTTLKAGYSWNAIESSDSRTSSGPVNLTRGAASAGFNLGLPLTSRRERVLDAVGDITLNFSGGIDHLSDFGTLTDWSAGLSWSPLERLGLQASYIVNQAAPGLTDLGNPQVQSFNVPVYDFQTGQTVLVTTLSGGNPALLRETQRDLKLSANWELPVLRGSNLLVEYFRNRSTNVTASFPLLTPAIEAAFPGRVTRDGAGNLVAIDARPVTFAEQKGERLRWGLNLSGPIGKAQPGGGGPFAGMGGGRPGGAGGAAPGGPRPGAGAGGGGGRGGMGAMMRGGGQGRWNLALYHTVQFESSVLVAPGGPVLDLLGGDALSGGGTPRHGLEFNGGAFHKGFGMFLQGSWSAPTNVRAVGLPGSSDLRFGALAKVNVNLFANLEQVLKDQPLAKGARLSLRFENLLDSHQKVTDGTGAVPISYQPDRLDPRGRFIEIELRKMF